MIKGFAHICFNVRDLNASLAFYQGVLGLKPAFDFLNATGERHGIYLHAGGRNFIELFQREVGVAAPAQSYQHFCLEVDDIKATVAALRARGIEVGPTEMGSDNSWRAWIHDPDGNRIELHAYTPQSKQLPSFK